MSFSFIVKPSRRPDFAENVDAASPSPPVTTDEGKALVDAIKDTLKTLAGNADIFGGEHAVCASVSGHAGGDGGQTSISISLYETVAQPTPEPTPAE